MWVQIVMMMILSMKELTYDEKLQGFGLLTLCNTRGGDDLITTSKLRRSVSWRLSGVGWLQNKVFKFFSKDEKNSLKNRMICRQRWCKQRTFMNWKSCWIKVGMETGQYKLTSNPVHCIKVNTDTQTHTHIAYKYACLHTKCMHAHSDTWWGKRYVKAKFEKITAKVPSNQELNFYCIHILLSQ